MAEPRSGGPALPGSRGPVYKVRAPLSATSRTRRHLVHCLTAGLQRACQPARTRLAAEPSFDRAPSVTRPDCRQTLRGVPSTSARAKWAHSPGDCWRSRGSLVTPTPSTADTGGAGKVRRAFAHSQGSDSATQHERE